jgi:hypothetical protein
MDLTLGNVVEKNDVNVFLMQANNVQNALTHYLKRTAKGKLNAVRLSSNIRMSPLPDDVFPLVNSYDDAYQGDISLSNVIPDYLLPPNAIPDRDMSYWLTPDASLSVRYIMEQIRAYPNIANLSIKLFGIFGLVTERPPEWVTLPNGEQQLLFDRNDDVDMFNTITNHENTFQKLGVPVKAGEDADNGYEDIILMDRIVNLITYDVANNRKGALVMAGVGMMIKTPTGKTLLARVAKCAVENCMINIVRRFSKVKIDDDILYKKFPALKPVAGKYTYITREQLDKVMKFFKITLRTYTVFGADQNIVWEELGAKKQQVLEVIISEEHATIRALNKKPKIEYHDEIYALTANTTDAYDIAYAPVQQRIHPELPNASQADAIPDIIHYRECNELGEITLHKTYQPKPYRHDEYPEFTDDFFMNCHNDNQYYAKIFRHIYELVPMTNLNIERAIVKSENFIPMRKFKDMHTTKIYEADMNKCYVSYESCKWYDGFPTSELYAYEYNPEVKFSFAVVKSMTNLPLSYRTLHNNTPTNVITYPTYQYLTQKGAVIEIDYVISAPHKNISILEFTETLPISPDNKKFFRNQLIGKIISGGLTGNHKNTYRYGNDDEYNQIIHECQKLGYEYAPSISFDEMFQEIEVTIPQKTTGAFYFHSYILAYASISMCEQFDLLTNAKVNITGYIVDAILFTCDDQTTIDNLLKSGSEVYGEFSYSKAKPYVHYMNQKNLTDFIIPTTDYEIQLHTMPAPTTNTMLIGAGGIGKTFPLIANPLYSQVILTHSRDARDNHRETQKNLKLNLNPNIKCLAGQYYPMSSNKEWLNRRKIGKCPAYKYVVIDEVFQYTKEIMEVVLYRAITIDKSIVVCTGDPEQIRNTISTPVNVVNIDGVIDVIHIETPENKKIRLGKNATLPENEQIPIPTAKSTPLTVAWLKSKGFVLNNIHRNPDNSQRHNFTYGTYLDTFREKDYIAQKLLSMTSTVLPKIPSADIQKQILDGTINPLTDHILSGTHKRLTEFNKMLLKLPEQDILVKDRNGKKLIIKNTDPAIYYDRQKMSDNLPKAKKYEPYFAVSPDTYQGTTAEFKIYVDVNNLSRQGTLYTAITRTRTPENTILIF